MGAQQLLEGLGLGLAQLREAHGSMPHGAVVLAELRPCVGVDGGRGVAILGKTRREERETAADIACIRQIGLMPGDKRLRT
ncbi:MAG: hypothetical protein RL134_2228 [Actinomycetota bacterium]